MQRAPIRRCERCELPLATWACKSRFSTPTLAVRSMSPSKPSRERSDALFVAPTPFLNVQLVQLAQLAAFYRLPTTHDVREFAEVGGLMSYGSDIADAYRQVGIYAGRIIKGAKT